MTHVAKSKIHQKFTAKHQKGRRVQIKIAYVTNCVKKLDEDNLRINLQKCHFEKTEIEWLGYKFTQTGISPLEIKTAAILAIRPPTKLKHLRSFLGSLHYILASSYHH